MANDLLRFVLQDTFATYIDETNNTQVPQEFEWSLGKLNDILNRIKNGSIDTQRNLLSDALNEGSAILVALDGAISGKISPAQNDFIQRLYTSLAILKSYQAIYINTPSVDVILGKLTALNAMAQTDIRTVESILSGNASSSASFEEKTKRTAAIDFSAIKGIDSIVADVKETVTYMSLFPGAQFLLFAGPPGTGKSVLSAAAATKFSGGVYYNLGVGELSSPFVGETEAGLIALFKKLAASGEKATIILDEFDTLFGNEQGHLNSVRTTIQTEIQGTGAALSNAILIIAITNFMNKLPKPIIRRVSKYYYVPPPSKEDCINYLLGKMQLHEPMDEFKVGISDIMGDNAYTNANMQTWYNNTRVKHITSNTKFTFFEKDGIYIEARPKVVRVPYDTNDIPVQRDQLETLTKEYILLPSLETFREMSKSIVPMTQEELKVFETENKKS